MRVFVAGATGAIGKQLVPRLVAAGHEVHGMTRSESKQAMLRELGAVPVVADALDPDQVAEAVGRARPDVIVHQLTAIGAIDTRHFDRDFAPTNRLRTEGTDHLLSAGQAVGVRRFVAQSNVASHVRAHRRGGEDRGGPARPAPPREMREDAGRDPSSRGGGPGRASGRRGSCCATARSTGRARRWRRAGSSSRWSASASSRWSATVAACGRSSTSPTPRRRRWRRSSTAVAASTTSSTMIPPPVAEWLPALAQDARRQEADARSAVRRPAVRRGDRRGDDDRASAARPTPRPSASWGGSPAHPSWRQGFAACMTDRERLLDELRPVVVRDRLPDARQRLRGRGRRAGGAAAGASGARRRRADRIAARVRRHRDHPAGDQRAALRARPSRALRRRVAAGADHHRRPR